MTNNQVKLADAVYDDNIKTVSVLLDHLDPNFVVGDKMSLLDLALVWAGYEIIELLVQKGADVGIAIANTGYEKLDWNATSPGEHPTYLYGNSEKDRRIRKLFFEKGADINQAIYGATILVDAIKWGEFELAKEFAEMGASLQVVDVHNWTPVNRVMAIISQSPHFELRYHRNADDSYADLVSKDFGSNITTDELSSSSLINWSFYGKDSQEYYENRRDPGIQLVNYLIEEGADGSSSNDFGWTPLMFASHEKYFTDIAIQLINAGANVNAVDVLERYSPLMLACDQGNSKLATLLLDSGADPDFVESVDNYSPLTRACIDLDTDLVRKLIEKGADVDSATRAGSTPMLCTLKVHRGILQLIDQGGDDPPSKSESVVTRFPPSSHRTDMILESHSTHLERIVRILLEAGASPFIRNDEGENMYDLLDSSTLLSQLHDALPPPSPRAN